MAGRKSPGKRQSNILSFFGKSPSGPRTPSGSVTEREKSSPVTATRQKTDYSLGDREFVKSSVRRTGSSSIGGTKPAKSADVRRDLSKQLDTESQPTRSNFPRSARKRALSQGFQASDVTLQVSERSKRARRVIRISDSDDEDDVSTAMNQDDPVHVSQLSVEDVDMVDGPSQNTEFNLSLLSCHARDGMQSGVQESPVQLPSHLEEARVVMREKLSEMDPNGVSVGNEEGGWCERHSWSKDIRDVKMRRPGDEGYDKTTLYIPKSEFRPPKQGGLTPFQRQFWEIKMKNYDTVLFMKKGKFYELYDVDADIGHEVLGLVYTKGGRVDMRCAGIPEQSFARHSARLLEHKYKVGRIEQVETVNGMQSRKARSSSSGATCIERKLVRIETRATVLDEAKLQDHRPRYVFAIVEDLGISEDSKSLRQDQISIGVCYIDRACGAITLREFYDDFRRTETDRMVSILKPQEILMSRRSISTSTSKLLHQSAVRSGAEILELFEDGLPEMTHKWLKLYLNNKETKTILDRVSSYIDSKPLVRRALGAMAKYFEGLMIDSEVFSLGNFVLKLDDSQKVEARINPIMDPNALKKSLLPDQDLQSVRMDASSLASLEVLANTVDGSEKDTLLSVVDHAKTPRGRRLLKKWVSAPLVRTSDIEDRLNAVDTLLEIDGKDDGFVLGRISKKLSSGKDIERSLPRLHAHVTSNVNAVMYDDSNKRRVKDFVKILRSLEDAINALEEANDALQTVNCRSERLSWLVRPGCGIPHEAREHLAYFFNEAFDVNAAETNGDVIPMEGAASDYFDRKRDMELVEEELKNELSKIKRALGAKTAKFFHRGSEKYQAEIDVRYLPKSLPREYEIASQTKAVKRLYTRGLKTVVKKMDVATEAFEDAGKKIVREIMTRFLNHFEVWSTLSKSSAEFDALMGLARASMGDGSGPMCRPTVLPNSHPIPVFHAMQMRHPVLASKSTSFIPNDVCLGENEPNIAILTGPNAGGKSTLSRQVAACALLAQIGCYVTAESLTFRPFEDVFVRMGANDDIARGLSTFMVEMQDVSNILNNASSHSLVIADEVGRGTSTHDGYAIAYGVLRHLAFRIKCLGIFSTHYTMLGRDVLTECSDTERANLGMYEMAASVDEKKKKITFLYKFQKGVTMGSRGICVARLAGIPDNIADEAEVAAADFEQMLSSKLDACSIQALVRDGGDDEGLLRVLKSI